jgi:hypothetical protein
MSGSKGPHDARYADFAGACVDTNFNEFCTESELDAV